MPFDEAKMLYEENGVGAASFFSDDTLRWFDSRVYPTLYDDCLFITSEPDWNGQDRRYTVRRFSEDFDTIESVSGFREFNTLDEAKDFIKDFIES